MLWPRPLLRGTEYPSASTRLCKVWEWHPDASILEPSPTTQVDGAASPGQDHLCQALTRRKHSPPGWNTLQNARRSIDAARHLALPTASPVFQDSAPACR